MGEIPPGSVRDAEVPGSNPGSPTLKAQFSGETGSRRLHRADRPGANLARTWRDGHVDRSVDRSVEFSSARRWRNA